MEGDTVIYLKMNILDEDEKILLFVMKVMKNIEFLKLKLKHFSTQY